MLNNLNLNNLSLDQLKKLEEDVESFLFAEDPVGEPFHPEYKKDKKLFKKLVKVQLSLKNGLDLYFQEQADNLQVLVNMYKVEASVKDEYLNNAYWDLEDGKLIATLEIYIGDLTELGIEYEEKKFNLDSGVTRNSLDVQKALRNYIPKLAGQVNDTTKKKIVEAIKTSIKRGEKTADLASRLNPIVQDYKRSVRIAQTESVRAFAEGQLAVGRRIGIKKKQWVTYIAEDDACLEPARQGPIPMEQEFANKRMRPPAHPHCRCLLELVFDPKTDTLDWDNTGQDY